MADVILRVFAVIGALTVLAVGVLCLACVATWLREVERRRRPFPYADLPAIPPTEYAALYQDIAAFEAGERP